MTLNRREFVQLATAMGASLAWGGSARASTTVGMSSATFIRRASRPAIPIEQRYPLDPAAVRVGRRTCAHSGGCRG